MRVLVTGAAGFIGYHVCRRLLERGDEVLGVDNLNPYYNPQLKHDRLAQLQSFRSFKFARIDLADAASTGELIGARPIRRHRPLGGASRRAILARGPTDLYRQQHGRIAQRAGGLPSQATGIISSLPRRARCTAILPSFPVHETADITRPVSLYAATKMAGELMAYSYADQYGLAVTALRLFTVYGPWGRPDMAIFKFTEAILGNQPVELYAGGTLQRDFTYVDDIVQGIIGAVDHPSATR